MKQRILFLVRYFFIFVAAFLLQKVAFMLYASPESLSLIDYGSVLVHAFSLDLSTAAYLTVLPWIVLVVSIFSDRFPLRKVLLPYYILVSFATSLIFCADAALYPFWDFKLDASVFFYLQSPKEALASVSLAFLLVGILIVLVLTAFHTWLLILVTPRHLEPCKPDLLSRLAQTGILLLVCFGIFVDMRGGLGKSTANVGKAYFCDDQFLNHSAVNPCFSLFYSMGKQEDFSAQFNFFSEQERLAHLDGLFPQETSSDSTLSVLRIQRPNVLFIIMEGFGGAFVEEWGGVADVAPNLRAIADSGIFFTNCYAGSYRTDRGTVCLISGYPGLPTTSVMKLPAKSRTLPSIAEQLRVEGYTTDFLYGGDINFTNMNSYLLSKGYQNLASDKTFPREARTNAWGVDDERTFDHLYQDIAIMPRTSPWHTAFLTLSSHEPFEVPYHRLSEPIPNAFAYTDSCLGDFIGKLRQHSLWDSLLVVCVPDHGFFYPRQGVNHAPWIHRIPMIWIGGAIRKPMRIDVLMNQIDLAATLLAQMGIDHKGFSFSRNVLSSSYRYPFAFYTYSNGLAFIDSTGTTLYDLDSRQTLIDQPASETRLNKAKALLQTIYDDLGSR